MDQLFGTINCIPRFQLSRWSIQDFAIKIHSVGVYKVQFGRPVSTTLNLGNFGMVFRGSKRVSVIYNVQAGSEMLHLRF